MSSLLDRFSDIDSARETFTFGPASCYVRKSGSVWNVHTPQTQRGQGYASGLMAMICEIFDARLVTLSLVCRLELVPWYETFGFVELGRFGGSAIMERPR